jgi:hypothetical protein
MVSGGGGGKPEPVTRSAADTYQSPDFPNFHYLRFQLIAGELHGEMVRPDTDSHSKIPWSVRDQFMLRAKAP